MKNNQSIVILTDDTIRSDARASVTLNSLVLRLMVGLALLSWPGMGSAQGTWSVISLPQKPGELYGFARLAVSVTGDLYVADDSSPSSIQKRDAQGNWSLIASSGSASGQVHGTSALAVDAAGNL